MLKRLGKRVELFLPAYSLEDVRARVLQMGDALGREDEAQALVARFDADLAALRADVQNRPLAALYYANGYTTGDQTLAGQILLAAGFENATSRAGQRRAGNLPLEVLAMMEPDTVVTGARYPGQSRSEAILDHPVIRALQKDRHTGTVADSDWLCGHALCAERYLGSGRAAPPCGRTRMKHLMILLGALVAVLFVASLVVGPAQAPLWASLKALFVDDHGPLTLVMREIRLPRALLGLMIGISLGMAGAGMQGYLRNPLADPGLIGVSGSAALGAVIAIHTGLAASFALGLPLAALAGALGSVFLILLLAGPGGGSLTLILAGIAISSLAGGAQLAGAEFFAQPVRSQRDRILDDGLACGSLDDPCVVGDAADAGGMGLAGQPAARARRADPG